MYLQKNEPVSSEKDVKTFQEQYDDQVDQKIFRQTSPTLAAPAKKKRKEPEIKVKLRRDPKSTSAPKVLKSAPKKKTRP